MTDVGDGVNQLIDFDIIIYDSANNLDGQPAILSLTLTDGDSTPLATASLVLEVVIFSKRLCDGDPCPEGQICVDDYCERE